MLGEGGEGLEIGGGGVSVEGGVGEDRAAVGVEQDVVRVDGAVGEARGVEMSQGVGERGEEGDQLAVREGAAAGEEGGQGAGGEVLGDQDPAGVGLAVLEQAGDVRMPDPGEHAEVLAEPPRVGARAERDVFEHGVAAGGAVPDLPDGARRSGPELPAQAVTGEVCEVHAQEDAPIATPPVEVIHSPGRRP